MADLAQAIVALGRASERRRHGANELIEASTVVARAIRGQLRTGDEVVVGPWLSLERSETSPVVLKLANLLGMEEDVAAELSRVAKFLRAPASFPRTEAPKGILVQGVPGTGKAMLAEALAGEAGVPLHPIAWEDDADADRLRHVFARARETAPCVVLVYGLEAAGDGAGPRQLAAEMDGTVAGSGVVVVLAADRVELLDPELMRPGRFDRRLALRSLGPAYRATTAHAADGGSRRDVLARNVAVLDTESGRGPWKDDVGRDLHAATAQERRAFIAEAEAVVRAFRELLDAQAQSYSEAARRAAKIVPR